MLRPAVVLLWLAQLIEGFHVELRSMDMVVYEAWQGLTLREKLPYLLDSYLQESCLTEFRALMRLQDRGDRGADSPNEGIEFGTVRDSFQEFQSEEDIISYFQACDENKNGTIDELEYIICRGDYDTAGNLYSENEYEILETIVIHDFEDMLNSSMDDETLSRVLGLEVDENGIIVDKKRKPYVDVSSIADLDSMDGRVQA
ncbi:hypothetical protein B484DRAFT_444797, partial [Ochromonadaceae sp. CCMP2298]